MRFAVPVPVRRSACMMRRAVGLCLLLSAQAYDVRHAVAPGATAPARCASPLAVGQLDRTATRAPTVPTACRDWQLDFYSRPVQGADGKKLWELLVTDSRGSFQHVEAVPSNCVNSRELRQRVQRLIDTSAVKPKSIKFFRAQMKNMITIALSDLPGVSCTPSRVTYELYEWLAMRQREVRADASLMPHRSPRRAPSEHDTRAIRLRRCIPQCRGTSAPGRRCPRSSYPSSYRSSCAASSTRSLLYPRWSSCPGARSPMRISGSALCARCHVHKRSPRARWSLASPSSAAAPPPSPRGLLGPTSRTARPSSRAASCSLRSGSIRSTCSPV